MKANNPSGSARVTHWCFRNHHLGFSAGLGLLLLAQTASAATLIHRYPFETNAEDVISGAHGVLQGSAFLTNGAVALNGTNAHVQLLDDLFTNYQSLSLAVWLVDEGSEAAACVYEFAASTNSTANSIFCSVAGDAGYRIATNQQVNGPMLPVARTNHLVWTQDADTETARLYVNGALLAENTNFTYMPSLVGTTAVNRLGARATPGGPFRGRIKEFRAYSGALSPLEVAFLDAAGPEQPEVQPGELQAVHLLVKSPIGPGALQRPGVLADFANLSNVNIVSLPEVTLVSDNTNVLVVTEGRRLRSVGLGVANLMVAYLGVTNEVSVIVTIPKVAPLAHRYSFNEAFGSRVAHDAVGSAHGRLQGGSRFTTGQQPARPAGQLAFEGLNPHVDLPDGILSCLSEVSLEAWFVWVPSGQWPRIFDFGDQIPAGASAKQGSTYLYLTAASSVGWPRAAVSTNRVSGERFWLDAPKQLHINGTSHVAVTYSPVRGVARLYVNGVLASNNVPLIQLADINDVNNWLGRAQFSWDSYFSGRFDEFRIYAGWLSDADIAANYAAGPNLIGSDFVLHRDATGTNLTLHWGPSAAGWLLKSSSTLGPTAEWEDTSPPPTFGNGRFRTTVSMSDGARYFRLQSP